MCKQNYVKQGYTGPKICLRYDLISLKSQNIPAKAETGTKKLAQITWRNASIESNSLNKIAVQKLRFFNLHSRRKEFKFIKS